MLMILALFAVLIIFTTTSFVHAAGTRGRGVREYTHRLTMTTRYIILSLISVKDLPLVTRCKSMGYNDNAFNILKSCPPPQYVVVSVLPYHNILWCTRQI
jgi:hypothetical protein